MMTRRTLIGLLAALTLGAGGCPALAPAATAATTLTPILRTRFAGTFDAAGSYAPGAGEIASGTLAKSGTTAVSPGRVTVNGGADGLSFVPSVALGSGSTVNTSVAVELTGKRGTGAGNLDTALSVGGGVDYRLIDSAGHWRFDMFGMVNSTMAKQAAPAPSTATEQHVGLVYTYVSDSRSTLDLYIDGCRVGTTLTNGSPAQLASNAIGFGREVHPSAPNRGFHGALSGVAAETFTGTFPGASAFQLAAGRQCGTPPITAGPVVPIGPDDSASTREAKAAAVRPAPRQLDWQAMKTTAFIHFNMPTFINAEGGDGRTLPSTFNPATVDTDQWATTLKAGGYKLAVLTVKHADGFLLYPSAGSDYSVKSSPYRNGQGDVVRQFVTSMRAQGIKVGIYFSPVNRHEMNVVPSTWNADYPRFGYSAAKGTRSCAVPAVSVAGKPSFTFTVDEYNCLYMRELYEVFGDYGPVDEWWIDGNATSYTPGGSSWDGFRPWPTATGSPTQTYANTDWYRIADALQPNMLKFNGWDIRWVGNETGFARIGGEWSTAAVTNQPTDPVPVLGGGGAPGDRSTWPNAKNLVWLPTEVDVPITANWFHHTGDGPKSPGKLWQIYAASVGRNANLLLSFAPDRTGRIPDAQVAAAAGLKTKVDAVFGNDLGKGCPVTVGEDGHTFTCHLPTSSTLDWIGLNEDVAGYGQRVEGFTVETWDQAGGTWEARPVTTWTNAGAAIADETARIGYQRYLHLSAPVTTTDVRVRVTSSRLQPHLSAITLHSER
ncbi:alpha-L-fucosidase [Streptomyces sp. NPDC051582]|uniref:alpha-L-fucosidase n=1 Tax=Streptomyces sp. NPDC051582 TaxID=3155167 RepID=UPI0034271A41